MTAAVVTGAVEVEYLGGEVRRVEGEALTLEFRPQSGSVHVGEEVIEWDLVRVLRTEGRVQLLH